MTAEFVRDAAATAAVFGFFASGWLGWAQDDPPPGWRRILATGSVLSLLTAVAGGILTWRNWSEGSAIDAETGPVFGAIVGIEVALAGLGALVLARRGQGDLTAAWVALVVGVHFFPLAPLLEYPLLYVVAALVTVAAVVSVPVARARGIAVSAVTGITVGTVLLGAALVSLVTVV